MSYDKPGPYGDRPQQPGGFGPPPQQPGGFGPPPPQPGPYGQPTVPPPPQQHQGQPGYGCPRQGYGDPQGQGGPQQPGPYGEQPGPYGGGQANPYGGQPGAFAQQQPPAYGQADAYGQQPQGSWGAHVPPAEPKRSTGKVVAIVAGAVVVAAVAGGAVFFLSGDGGGSGGGGYRLSTPASVLGGKYTKDAAQKAPASQTGDGEGIENGKSLSAVYKSGGGQLSFGGAYGDVTDPRLAVDTIVAKALKGSKASEQKPAGFDGEVMKCGEMDFSVFKAPFCVWGDDSTAALVMYSPSTSAAAEGELADPPSVQEWAETAAQFRSDVRTKK
ncbi:hypothetical protein AB0C51_18105 [Streptomyces pathocidini]|uniref:hypothetical protein n=1 Tax=Streptomyces pathocidini TaxID=1650571 RepID=UPI0033EB3D8C